MSSLQIYRLIHEGVVHKTTVCQAPLRIIAARVNRAGDLSLFSVAHNDVFSGHKPEKFMRHIQEHHNYQ